MDGTSTGSVPKSNKLSVHIKQAEHSHQKGAEPVEATRSHVGRFDKLNDHKNKKTKKQQSKAKAMKSYMYILECSNGNYYTGSTNNLERRLAEHQDGRGANFTKKHLPVKLVYFEEFQKIDHAFYREKQVQGWSRKKKEALITGGFDKLSHLSKNYTQFPPPRICSVP